MKILFLCSGNIHRSALAEAMLRERARRDGRSDVAAASAGVIAVDGMEAVPEAADLARAAGIDLSGHRSTCAAGCDLAQYDAIVAMERLHREWVGDREPDALPRCRLLSEFAGPAAREMGVAPGDDVPDAIGMDLASFRRSFAIIEECVERLYLELAPAPQDAYFRAIEQRFASRRHTLLTLSPADFSLMESWWDRGIPLWIVLTSIDAVLGRKEASGEPSRVRRLSFFRPEVEERFAAYERARSGADAPAAAPSAGGDEILQRAAGRLREAASQARNKGLGPAADLFERIAGALAGTPPEHAAGPAAARLRLHAVEEEMIEGLQQLARGEVAEIQASAASQLREYRARMTPAAFEATVSRLVAERLKERYGAPDLAGP